MDDWLAKNEQILVILTKSSTSRAENIDLLRTKIDAIR